MDDSLEENILIRLPVKITYQALGAFLREKLKGKSIETENKGEVTKYATILDIALARSLEDGFDLAVDLKFKTLTSLFRNKEGSILLDVAMDFNHGEQRISIKDYTLKIDSKSWLLNKSMEMVANSFVYEKMKKKMQFDLRPLIEEQLVSVNEKLEDSLEIAAGIYANGFLVDFNVAEILPGDDFLLVIVEIEASTFIDIRRFNLKGDTGRSDKRI